MLKVLKHVAKKERLSLPDESALSIMHEANGNMRKALLIFEALRMQRSVSSRSKLGYARSPCLTRHLVSSRTPARTCRPTSTSPRPIGRRIVARSRIRSYKNNRRRIC